MLTRNTPGNEFAGAFASSMREFAEIFFQQLAPACRSDGVNWRAEACAALWAATQAVFDSSVLSPGERKDLTREITRNLVPFWQRQCATRSDVSPAYRPGDYNHASAPGNLVGAADSIVAELMRSCGVPLTERSVMERTLSGALAQRMLADLRRIDEYKKRRERRRPARFSVVRA
jgi:hypothetical protein